MTTARRTTLENIRWLSTSKVTGWPVLSVTISELSPTPNNIYNIGDPKHALRHVIAKPRDERVVLVIKSPIEFPMDKRVMPKIVSLISKITPKFLRRLTISEAVKVMSLKTFVKPTNDAIGSKTLR